MSYNMEYYYQLESVNSEELKRCRTLEVLHRFVMCSTCNVVNLCGHKQVTGGWMIKHQTLSYQQAEENSHSTRF